MLYQAPVNPHERETLSEEWIFWSLIATNSQSSFFSQGFIHSLASFGLFSLITCSHKICKQDIYLFENKVGRGLKNYWGEDGWRVIFQENVENQIPSAWQDLWEAAVLSVQMRELSVVFLESQPSRECHVPFCALPFFLHKPSSSQRWEWVYQVSAIK